MLPCLCSRKSLSSISSMPCQVFDLVLSLEFAISSFLSRTILVSNLVPLRLLLPLFLLSRLRLVFVSISTSTPLQYRRYTLVRLRPYLRVFPTLPSAIFNFYQLAFVNVSSYSVPTTFNLFSIRFSAPTHPPLLVSSPIVVNRHRRCRFRRRGDRAWWGGT